MKAVLMSIKPKWCELIASGKKTVEVRKTKPKLETPFKVYIYATKGGDRIVVKNDKVYEVSKDITGKIIGEFICRNIDFHNISELIVKEDADIALAGTCLSKVDVLLYIGYPSGTDIYAKPYDFYGWNISDLVIYDKPKELGAFYQKCKSYDKDEWDIDNLDCIECRNPCGNGGKLYLKRPPQSWCFVEELKERKTNE